MDLRLHQTQVRHLAHGAFELFESEKDLSRRLGLLSEKMQEILEIHRPQAVVIESIFLGKNIQSAFKLGHARGVIIAEAAKRNCEVFEYATRLVKKGLTGNGGAEKEHVRYALQALLSLSAIQPIDASDALAMAFYHSLEVHKKMLFRQMREMT